MGEFPYYNRHRDRYPSRKEQQQLQAENNEADTPMVPRPCITKTQESNLLKEVTVFSLASHLLWCLWSLKHGQTSSIPFAYYNYARDKMEDYKDAKSRVEELWREEQGS